MKYLFLILCFLLLNLIFSTHIETSDSLQDIRVKERTISSVQIITNSVLLILVVCFVVKDVNRM